MQSVHTHTLYTHIAREQNDITMFGVSSSSAIVGLLVVVMQFLAAGALKCVCNPDDCEAVSSDDCPGKGIVTWDPCKCV